MKSFFSIFLILFIFSSQLLKAQSCNPIVSGPSYTVTFNTDFGFASELRIIIFQANAGGVPCNIFFNMADGNTITLSNSLPSITVPVSVQGTNMATGQPVVIDGQNFVSAPALNFTDPSSCYTSNMSFINFTPLYYVVTNTNDSGIGSLRQGITNVNAAGGGFISFNIPGTPPHKISCLSELPVIISKIYIDGSTQPTSGYTGTDPLIEIDGTGLSSTSKGLYVAGADNCEFYGLYIHNFGYGIRIDRSYVYSTPIKLGGKNFIIGGLNRKNVISNNSVSGIYIQQAKSGVIEYNYIGTNSAGTASQANAIGIYLNSDTLTQIRQNLISGNTMEGINSTYSISLKITGNKIGTNLAGTAALGNQNDGMQLVDSYATIGGTLSSEANVISGNNSGTYQAGINCTGGRLKIIGNKIGTDVIGSTAIPNYIGILNNAWAESLFIGGSTTAERNIISGNQNAGLYIKSVVDTVYIKGNYVGLNSSGNASLANGAEGMVVWSGANVIVIGGTASGDKNVISGNTSTGIYADYGASNSAIRYEILNNIIGLNPGGSSAIPNGSGISTHHNLSNLRISGNVVSGNTGIGMIIAGDNHTIINNKIGTNATGTLIAGNSTGINLGIEATNITIGGSGPSDPNLIVNNSGYGIFMNNMASFPTRYNKLSRNLIYNNGNKGISQGTVITSLANDGYEKPVITWATPNKVEGTAPANAVIEIYENHTLNSYTQGKTYLATVNADASGYWEYSAPLSNPYNLTSLAIHPTNNNTSEYSDKYNYSQWTGAISNDWHVAGNWTNGVPGCNIHAVIPNVANDPAVISGDASAYDLLISNSGSLTISSGMRLMICQGNFENDGLTDLGAGTIIYQGSTLQKIYGTSKVGNLTIDNSGEGIELYNDQEVTQQLYLTNGIITTGPYILNHSSTNANDLSIFSSSSFIFGNLRRNISPNTNTYAFPLGNGTSPSNYYRLDFINNNITGVNYLSASVSSQVESGNNIDTRLNVTELVDPYININEIAVWKLTPDALPVSGSYGIRLYTENISNLVDNRFAVLKRPDISNDYADWDNFAGTSIPSTGNPGRTVSSGYAERTGFNSFSNFAIANATDPLPVAFLNFSAQENLNEIYLSWSTAFEKNNDYFLIQRSENGKTFGTIGQVAGAENSFSILDYSFYDKTPLNGISYYRIAQVDQDGSFSYSAVIRVKNENNSTFDLSIFPNPSSGTITIQGSDLSDNKITFSDLMGREVFPIEKETEEVFVKQYDMSHLPKGLYIVSIHTLKGDYAKRIALQ